jgi:hypothetical protein
MPISFDNFNVRVNRGTDLLKTLNDEVGQWQQQAPEVTHERSDDRTVYVSSLRFHAWPDMHRWAAIAGDIVANYRGSLDHLLRSIAVAASGQDPPPRDRRLQFPICDDTDAFGDALRNHRLGELSANEAFVDAVRAVQPFNSSPALARLRDLDDQHKHRTLAIGAYNVESFDFAMQFVRDAEVRITEGPLEREATLFGVKFPEPADIGEINLRVVIRLSFLDEAVPRRSMLHVLNDSRLAVLATRNALVRAFEQ